MVDTKCIFFEVKCHFSFLILFMLPLKINYSYNDMLCTEYIHVLKLLHWKESYDEDTVVDGRINFLSGNYIRH